MLTTRQPSQFSCENMISLACYLTLDFCEAQESKFIQQTLMPIRNYFTCWWIHTVRTLHLHVLVLSLQGLGLGLRLMVDLHVIFSKNHTVQIHTKSPPRKIVTVSHEIGLVCPWSTPSYFRNDQGRSDLEIYVHWWCVNVIFEGNILIILIFFLKLLWPTPTLP